LRVLNKSVLEEEALKVFEETGVLPESVKVGSTIKILPDFKHERVIIEGNVDKLFVRGKDLWSLEIKKGANIGCIDVCDKGQIRALVIYGKVGYLKVYKLYDEGKILTVRICPEGFLGGASSQDPVIILQLFLQGIKVFVRRDTIEKELKHL
jgi:hypothetical protein